MKPCFFIIVFFSLAFSFGLKAQDKKLKKADKVYQKFDYVKAINLYEGIAGRGYSSPELYKKLGNSYYYMAKPEQAASWYQQLMEESEKPEANYYYRYAQSLKAGRQFNKANSMLGELAKNYPNDIRGKLYKENPLYLERIFKDSSKYTVSHVAFNSPYSDYAPSITENNIVFTSARDTGFLAKNIQSWNYRAFTDIYTVNDKGNRATKLPKKINSKYNESTAFFTKNGKKVYFTRNNADKKKLINGNDNINRLQIFQADVMENGEWANLRRLPFSSDEYSVAHPTLNKEETVMFFVSDMPGGKGMSDIYAVAINTDGSYGEPTNLGAQINTESRESFPYISPQGKLYFASDGQPGLGGFDIFSAEIDSQLQIQNVANLGAGINSPQDDFSITMYPDGKSGYFASNRKGGTGSDDIYMFANNCLSTITGNIANNQGSMLENAMVVISNHKKTYRTTTDTQGNYMLGENFDCGSRLSLHIEKEGFLPIDTVIETGSGKTYNFTLETESLNERLALNEIYFGFDKSDVTDNAKQELDKIVAFLTDNKGYRLEIVSYTDRIGKASYNLKLSQQRAQATANYLISHGISANRITSQGKGEAQLATKCFTEGPCNKPTYKENRRSEFKLIKTN
ncbi:OmpA family protein [Galbibacter sp. PAP.153]|uniref:OmpA family protein n=1 Tax=Galbibacter sp. PAP.153 TaxID=3104623 RepID=UPI00300A469F